MLFINNKPYIVLDEFIDIEKLLSLEDEFYFLMSTTQLYQRIGIWSAGGHDPSFKNAIDHESDMLYFVHHRANVERKTNKQLDNYISQFEKKNDLAGLARFYKLKYKAFDPYTILNIRNIVGESYEWLPIIQDFPNIKNFIESLPLENIGVITIFYNEHYVPLSYHRDFGYFPLDNNKKDRDPTQSEFIWMRFNLDREFCIFDITEKTINQTYKVEGYSIYFNDHNWHGNFKPLNFSSITLKVEGQFKNYIREKFVSLV